MVILLIDSQEPKEKVAQFQELGFTCPPQTPLDTGDYLAVLSDDKRVMIERKTVEDFDTSMSDDSVFDQANRISDWLMLNRVNYAYLIIVGDLDYVNEYAKVFPKQRLGAIASIIVRNGIPVIPVQTEMQFNYMISRLVIKHEQNKSGQMRPVDLFQYKYGKQVKEHDFVHLLCLADGISLILARKIYDHFKWEHFDEIVDSDFTEVQGVGRNKANEIIKKLHLRQKSKIETK